jgi:hypothetical protein
VTRPPAACRRPAALGLALAALVAACSGVDDPGELGPTPLEAGEPQATSRLASIRVVVQPPGAFSGDEPALEVAAVFAQYRGYDEAAARTRLDLQRPLGERLRPGHCASSDLLAAGDEPAPKDTVSKDSGARELVLLDAGNLTVSLGEAAIDVPLALVPDLVPTISGVNYTYLGDALPSGAWPPGEPAPSELAIRVDGEGEDLPGFTLRPRLPEPTALTGRVDRDRDELRLDWRSDSGGEPLALRLVSLIGGEPIGEELTCLVEDDGSFVADLDELHALGLDGGPGTALRVAATRSGRTLFDAGEFVGAEAVVEVRTVTVLGE